MNLDLWKLFYEVASIGNISKASEKLHISQPAITKQIKNLEESLNSKLFIRTQKGVILTTAGKLIYDDIKKGLNIFEIAEQKINDNNDLLIGNIRIGCSTSLTKTYLMPFIKKFHEKYPNITFEISTDPTHILKDKMKEGNLDFIIAKFPIKMNDDFDYTMLGQTHDIFIASKKYSELFNSKISLKEIVKYPILLQKQPSSSRDFIELFCKNNSIKLHTIMEIASSNLLIEFTKIGYGIGIVTKKYVQNALQRKELFEIDVEPKMPARNFGIITFKNNYLSRSCEEFIKILTDK